MPEGLSIIGGAPRYGTLGLAREIGTAASTWDDSAVSTKKGLALISPRSGETWASPSP